MSPRRRKDPKLAWLPTRVYVDKYGYRWRPRNGANIWLAPVDASSSAVLKAYERAVNDYAEDTVSALIDDYLKSQRFLDLAAKTQKDYLGYAEKVRTMFGKIKANQIEPHHIRKYLDIVGQKHPTAANRRLAFMSTVFGWGYERGRVKKNPCKGVRKHRETPRERYIEDWEYDLLLKHADDALYAALEISYLCAARRGDVLALQRQALKPEGVFIRQGKTGVRQIKEWTPRLKAAIDKGLAVPSTQPSMFVIHTKFGTKLSDSGLRAKFVEARKRAMEERPDMAPFTFHDIKAKAISDYQGSDKREFSGHKTESQVAVYDRKVRVSPTLDPDKERTK